MHFLQDLSPHAPRCARGGAALMRSSNADVERLFMLTSLGCCFAGLTLARELISLETIDLTF